MLLMGEVPKETSPINTSQTKPLKFLGVDWWPVVSLSLESLPSGNNASAAVVILNCRPMPTKRLSTSIDRGVGWQFGLKTPTPKAFTRQASLHKQRIGNGAH